jgi:FkbH-like protein
MRTAEFLYPDDLAVTPTAIRRVLIIGSRHALSFETYLERHAEETVVEFLPHNNLADLPDDPPSTPESYDFHLIQVPLSSLTAGSVIGVESFAERADTVLQSAKIALRRQLDASLTYNRRFGVLSFVANFPVPQRAPDLRWLARQLNDELARLVEGYAQVFVIDVGQVEAVMGKQPGRIEPLPLLETLDGGRPDEVFAALWRQCISIYRTINQIDQVRMVVFDLDDTLWRGRIAEHYGDGGGWPVFHGWPTGLWEAVHHLRARGIITAICSKNDAVLVAKRWSRAIPAQWLSLDHFVFQEINFEPKPQNLERMIARAGLTPKSVVFVDDNPVEREAARAALPGLRTIGANPFVTRRILLWSPETQEPAALETMLHQQHRRERDRGATSRAEFLMDLGCRVQLSIVTGTADAQFACSFELLNRTNQFNTTGVRWTYDRLVTLFRRGGRMIVFEVEDRFSQYGLVGVILYRRGHFIQFAMSCRVLGLEIESSVINAILRHEAARMDHASAEVVATDANMVCLGIYTKCGFTSEPARPGHFIRARPEIAPVAEHLTMVWTDARAIRDRSSSMTG